MATNKELLIKRINELIELANKSRHDFCGEDEIANQLKVGNNER